MNTNPDAKRILCFGDSNTRGVVPHDLQEQHGSRWPSNVRWTGIVQDILGDKYEIIEFGLSGATTIFDWIIHHINRKASIYLSPLIRAHRPLDVTIIALGSNDLRSEITQSASEVYEGLMRIIQEIQRVGPDIICVLVISAQPIENTLTQVDGNDWVGVTNKFQELRQLLLKSSGEFHVLDLSEKVEFEANDGLHMDADNHAHYGKLVAAKIKELTN